MYVCSPNIFKLSYTFFSDAIYPDVLKPKQGNMQVSNDDLKVCFLFERAFVHHSIFFGVLF